MPHIVLLGDSVFDNAAYVSGGPDVVQQLRALLPAGWRASLNALDGAVMGSITTQLARLPPDASHLVLSVGGNDALSEVNVLEDRVDSVFAALERLAEIRDGFACDYGAVLADIVARGLPTAVCTIYDPRYPDAAFSRVAAAALALINDVITREAFSRDVALIDLRIVCGSDQDFANPIEPSVIGGQKIAAAVASFAIPDNSQRSRVIVR